MPGGVGRYPGGVGGGSVAGVLRFGPDTNNFADNSARDTYATANPTWLAEYDDDDSLVIQVGSALQRRVSGAWTQLDSTPPVLPNLATVAEVNAGTETNLRMFSPLRVRQAARATVAARVPAVFQTGDATRISQAKTFGGAIVDFDSATRTGPAINLNWTRADGSTDSEALSARMMVEAFEALGSTQRLDIDSGTQGQLPIARVDGHGAHVELPPDYQPGTDSLTTNQHRTFSPANVAEIAEAVVEDDVEEWARDDSTPIPAGKLTNAPSTPGQGGGGGLTAQEATALIAQWARAGDTSAIPESKQRTAAQTRTLIGAATTAQTGLVPSLPTQNAARHFLAGDGAFDEIDWVDIQNRPTIPTLRDAPTTRTLIGAPTINHGGLAPQLVAVGQQQVSWLRGDGTWQSIPWTAITGRPTIPTLRDAAATLTLIGFPATTSGNSRYLREDGTWQTVSHTQLSNQPSIPTLRTRAETETLLGLASTTQNGLLRQLSGTATEFMAGDGTWRTPAGGSDGGGGGQTWPDAIHTSLGADVSLPTSATADTYGAWTETYRLTNSTAEEHKYLFFADLLCAASWWPGSDGADRGGAEFRVRIFNSANVQQRELVHELPVYIRTGSAGFDTLSHYDVGSINIAFELQANEYLLIEGRGISQKGGSGRSITVSNALSNIDYVDVTDVGGGGSGGTGLTTVSRNATLTGDGTSGSPLGVANPFTDTDEARLDTLTDAYLQELARDAIAAALRQGAGISIASNDNANTITITSTITAPGNASLTARGIIQLASAAQALAGTDGDLAVTPLALAGLRPTADPLAPAAAAVRGATNRFSDEAHQHPLDHSHSAHSTHTRYIAASADTTFVAADFTGGVSTTTDQASLPSFTANRYIGLAIPADEDDLTFFRNVGGINQIQAFTKQAGTLTINGVAYKWWRSNRAFLPAASGRAVEFGS